MSIVLTLIFIIACVYILIPNYYYRNLSRQIIKRVALLGSKIALTFDDGPNQQYTQLLLDLLKMQEIKATFFVVVENAKNNKHIIQRMREEGHTIAVHSLRHKSAAISNPFEYKRDFKESIRIMDSLGVKVKYFRPPWGTFNIFTYYFAKVNGLKTVLWSINAKDWSKHTSADDIRDKLVKCVVPGDIIVLHDNNGSENAPLRTIKALEGALPELKNKGFKFVALESWEREVDVEDN